MEERYNVYFAGQILDGFAVSAVRDKLAKVFNADQATLDKLFSGKLQSIKRDCDAATAAKYKQALERAGAVPVIKRVEATPAPTASASTAATDNTPPPPLTAAERIAALAAAPDATRFQQAAADTAATAPSAQPTQQPEPTPDDGSIALAPPGTAVLRESERALPVAAAEVDTSRLAVDATAARLSEEPPPPPAAPDTHHISMGEVGDTIPNLPSSAVPLSPDTSEIVLSAPGTDFSDCTRPAPQAAPLDLAHLNALPPGDRPADERERRAMPVATPSTDHIALEN